MSKIVTPWGVASSVSFYDPDKTIMHAHAAEFGGIGVALTRAMPAHLAALGIVCGDARWFEQDRAWAAVAIAFPRYFSRASAEAAREVLMRFFPCAYTRQFGERVTSLDSDALEQASWEDKTVNHFVVTGSFGSWAWDVPEGYVYAAGWRRRDEATTGFLVPVGEFNNPERLILDDFQQWEPNRSKPFIKPGHEHEALVANGRGFVTSLFAALETADDAAVFDFGCDVNKLTWFGEVVQIHLSDDQRLQAKDQPVYVDERGGLSFTDLEGESHSLRLTMLDRRPMGTVDLASMATVKEVAAHA